MPPSTLKDLARRTASKTDRGRMTTYERLLKMFWTSVSMPVSCAGSSDAIAAHTKKRRNVASTPCSSKLRSKPLLLLWNLPEASPLQERQNAASTSVQKKEKKKQENTHTHTHTHTQTIDLQSRRRRRRKKQGAKQNAQSKRKRGKKTQKKKRKTTNDQTDKTLEKLPPQHSQLLEFAKGNEAESAVKISRICNEAGRGIIASKKKFDLVSFVFFVVVFFNLSLLFFFFFFFFFVFFPFLFVWNKRKKKQGKKNTAQKVVADINNVRIF